MELFIKKSNKINTLNFSKNTTNNYFEIFYFDINIPYVIIKTYKNKKLIKSDRIDLDQSQVEKGVITNYNEIVNYIHSHVSSDKNEKGKLNKYFIDLKIASSSIFKSVISLPKISFLKALQLKQKELRDSFEKYSKNYTIIENKYYYDLGVVYNEHFLKNSIIKNWKEIANITNTKLSSIQLFSGFLFSSIKDESTYNFVFKKNEEDKSKELSKLTNYVIVYISEGVTTFVLVNDNQLINTYSFKYKNIDEIVKTFALTISKHEFEFAKKKIEDVFVDSDTNINLGKYIRHVNVHNIHFRWKDSPVLDIQEAGVNEETKEGTTEVELKNTEENVEQNEVVDSNVKEDLDE